MMLWFYKTFLRRIFNRFIFALRFKDMWDWSYESCDNCGINYRLPFRVRDKVWLEVHGEKTGCLCVNCFLEEAEKKNIKLKLEDLGLWIFVK